MSIYNGLPGNESVLGLIGISGATNATPIEVTTAANHGLVTGEYVEIYGVNGNHSANGRFYVLVTAANKFKLYSAWVAGAVSGPVAGVGAYVASADDFCRPIAFSNAETLPEDLITNADASSVNAPLEGNFDRESYLLRRTGSVRSNGIVEGRSGAAGVSSWHSGVVPNSAWGDSNNLNTALLGGLVIAIMPGDSIECKFQSIVKPAGAGDHALIRLLGELNEFDNTASGEPDVLGSPANFDGDNIAQYASIDCQILVRNNTNRALKLVLFTQVYGMSGTFNYDFVADSSIIVQSWAVNT